MIWVRHGVGLDQNVSRRDGEVCIDSEYVLKEKRGRVGDRDDSKMTCNLEP